MHEEAAVLGMPFDQRGKRSDEQLDIFRLLFNEEEPDYDGRFYQLPKVRFEPKPIQNPVPIWVGGNSPGAFRRAARYGQGFHAAFQPLSIIEKQINEVKRCCEAINRDPDELTWSTRVYLDPDSLMESSKSIAGSRQQMLSTIAQMEAIGLSHVVLDPVAPGGITGRLEAVERFMLEVVGR